jgi:Raf kinase inhibitor-like YbhB/YbcL family protein
MCRGCQEKINTTNGTNLATGMGKRCRILLPFLQLPGCGVGQIKPPENRSMSHGDRLIRHLKPLFATLILLSSGCGGGESKLASNGVLNSGYWSMYLKSPAIADGQPMPVNETADGKDQSPPLNWSAGPSGIRQFLLIAEDPDAPGDVPAVHWIVYNIPANVTHLDEGAGTANNSALSQGMNYQAVTGYVGPNPPPGRPHRYFFQLFALDTTEKLPPNLTLRGVEQAVTGHVLAQARLVGTYERK